MNADKSSQQLSKRDHINNTTTFFVCSPGVRPTHLLSGCILFIIVMVMMMISSSLPREET